MTFLIDTNILIDHLRGESRATKFLLDVETGRTKGCVSVLTEYELLSDPCLQPSEKREIERLLNLMPRLAITSRVARLAAEFRSGYDTDIADALNAATSKARNATLVTRNIKDFKRIKDLKLYPLL